MKKFGELNTEDEVLGGRPSKLQWVGSILKKTISWAGIGYSETELPVEERLVVMPILQVCGNAVFVNRVLRLVCRVNTQFSVCH